MSRFNKLALVAGGLSGMKVAVVTFSETDGGSRAGASSSTAINNARAPPRTTDPTTPPIKDTTAPKIVITSPSVTRGVGVQSTACKMTVLGRALDDSGVKNVLAQGVAARLDARGNFSAEVSLETGDNLITVTAAELYGNPANECFADPLHPT